MDEPLQSYGEKAVGREFNPSNNPQVDAIKVLFATVVNQLNDYRNMCNDIERQALFTEAIRQAQTASMWAIKAITY